MGTAKLTAIISADSSRFRRTMGEVKSSVSKTAKAIGAIGIIGGAFSVKKAIEFEKQMANINTLLNLGKDELRKFSKEVLAVGADLGATTEELTGGLYNALSQGIPKGNSIDFLRTAVKAAKAGATDTKTAVDALTNVMGAYSLKAEPKLPSKTTFERIS